MAMNEDIRSTVYKGGLKIEGELGDLQIVEESDTDNDNLSQKQKVEPNLMNRSNIPTNLIQNTLPVFEKVSVINSENVQFGNNTYFNGSVTIKQIVQNKSGIDNLSYVKDKDEEVNTDHKEKATEETKKIQILLWHKVTFSTACIAVITSIITIVFVLQNKSEQQIDTQDSVTFKAANNASVVGYCIDNFQMIIISFLLFLTLAITYSLLTKFQIGNGICIEKETYGDKTHKYPLEHIEKVDPILIAPDHLRMVNREDWLAQPVESPLTKLKQPVPWVVITHTATGSCFTQSQCVYRVRSIQTFHIESRGWSDISYNFLVGGEGSVYYGRGWDYEGAHTKGYNKYSIGIAFIGTFNNDQPTKQQVEACEKIIKRGVELGKISKDYVLFGHRQLMSTLSPGDQIFNIIKTWPHFVQNVTHYELLLPKY